MNYTDEEKRVIKLFAGVTQPAPRRMRQDAVAAHQAMMRRMLLSSVVREALPYNDPHFEFMREIDNPCPCPILKARWRAEVLK